MPESPEQLYARVANSLRMPPVEDWETFPFDGDLHPRPLRPPINEETPREGAGGIDCRACTAPDDQFIWTTERWRLLAFERPSGLPVILILQPRAHYGEPGDLPDHLAEELGVMLSRIERAVRAVPHVGRVHVCRWGDGSEHLHWWFMARPARLPQLIGSFAAIWDDILRDITMSAVSIAPLDQIEAYRKRMGWTFPWYSSKGSDFNFDYHVSFDPAQVGSGKADYNYRTETIGLSELPGVSVFSRDRGKIYHTYSTYARGLDMLNVAYHYMDLVPKGRDENEMGQMGWLHRRDEYPD